MLDAFLKFISDEKLFATGDKMLLAVSGGMDSVVMADLFSRAGIPVVIAHCNFRLRGEESAADEEFVRRLASACHTEFRFTRFDTTAYASAKKLSIQEAARELRYRWFSELLESESLAYCATAHHLNDSVETVFFNLARGAGLSGLHGIPVRKDRIIRPLLFATRKEIEAYATERGLSYREDSSNASDKYSRNKIRNSIIPLFREINPALEQGVAQTIRNIGDVEEILAGYLQEKKKEILTDDGSTLRMSIPALKDTKGTRTVLFELLKPYGFNTSVVQDIYDAIGKEPGRQFYSSTHKLVADRAELILYPRSPADRREYSLDRSGLPSAEPFELDITFEACSGPASFPAEKNTGLFDSDVLTFPLVLRKWRNGDFFYPLGMDRRKKLSDFFIDAKLSIRQKEEAWILTSGKDVVWIVGHRIDNRYRISENTRNICRITCKI